MSNISLRLPDNLLKELDHYAKKAHLARTDYIRQAVEQMNKKFFLSERAEHLKKMSLDVRANSMEVNAEFSRIEHDPEA